MEIFKTIENYPNYEFSSQNRLRNKTTGKFLKLHSDNCFQLCKEGKPTNISLSKLKHKYFSEPIEYLSGEIFLVIEGFPNYEISTYGRVYNNEKGTFLIPQLDNCGYYRIHLSKKIFKIHKLVAIAFLPNPKNLPCIDHINRIRTDNRVENLRWVSHSENRINSLRNRELPKNIWITTNKKYWRIHINQPGFEFCKCYRIDQYTLEQVKEIRNEQYRKHSRDIID